MPCFKSFASCFASWWEHRQEINCFYWVKSIWPASKDIFEVWNKDTSRTHKTSSGLEVSKQDTRTISIKFAFFINLSKFQVFLWYVCYLVIFLYDINVIATNQNCHCVKSVQLRSYFWSIFSCIRTEYRDLLRKSPYLIQIQENTNQKKRRIWTLFTYCVAQIWNWKTWNFFRVKSIKTRQRYKIDKVFFPH